MRSFQTAKSARMNMMSRNGRSLTGLGQEAKGAKAKVKAIKVEIKAKDSPAAVDAAPQGAPSGIPQGPPAVEMVREAVRPVSTSG